MPFAGNALQLAAYIRATNPKSLGDAIVASGLRTTYWESYDVPGVTAVDTVLRGTFTSTPNAPQLQFLITTSKSDKLPIYTVRYGSGSAEPFLPADNPVPTAACNNHGWIREDSVATPSLQSMVALGLPPYYVLPGMDTEDCMACQDFDDFIIALNDATAEYALPVAVPAPTVTPAPPPQPVPPPAPQPAPTTTLQQAAAIVLQAAQAHYLALPHPSEEAQAFRTEFEPWLMKLVAGSTS